MPTVSIGTELEMYAEDQPCPTAFREYYDNQWEINDTFVSIMTTRKGNSAIADCIGMAASESLQTLREYIHYAVVDLEYTWSCARGLVFNGLHVHIGGDVAHLFSSRRSLLSRFENTILGYYARKFGIDDRLLLSHHLWGAKRDTIYDWKSRPRYFPVVVCERLGTIEVRVFHAKHYHNADTIASILCSAYFDAVTGGGEMYAEIGRNLKDMMFGIPADFPFDEATAEEWLKAFNQLKDFCNRWGIQNHCSAGVDGNYFYIKAYGGYLADIDIYEGGYDEEEDY